MSEHYQRSIHVKATPEVAYRALTDGYDRWWTQPDNPFSKTGDCATFTFPPGKSFWTFEAQDLQPNKFIRLTCVDAHHLHPGEPKEITKEWLGTELCFEIEALSGETCIKLTHIGLHPDLHCYGICEAGWDFFFLVSLQALLDSGVGQPHIALPVDG